MMSPAMSGTTNNITKAAATIPPSLTLSKHTSVYLMAITHPCPSPRLLQLTHFPPLKSATPCLLAHRTVQIVPLNLEDGLLGLLSVQPWTDCEGHLTHLDLEA
ncbi:hypothetical protein K435DRAFT_179371 [Dendrothele bispora CBS 962.96]|uniref:Uncharacterized protein n=1 Tax=Dendrothele bispora (strain CBS 962.96) TaxID=1314807 RepID=A0A4S8MPW7_DENBC|nr:hypothetical protein K435DRAFT_179371 [Dendrothele bispora CBS 962.96]